MQQKSSKKISDSKKKSDRDTTVDDLNDELYQEYSNSEDGEDASSDEEPAVVATVVESPSPYMIARAERIARNQQRLRDLGLIAPQPSVENDATPHASNLGKRTTPSTATSTTASSTSSTSRGEIKIPRLLQRLQEKTGGNKNSPSSAEASGKDRGFMCSMC